MKVGMALPCFVVGKATSFSCTDDQIELAITIKDGTTGSCTEYVLSRSIYPAAIRWICMLTLLLLF